MPNVENKDYNVLIDGKSFFGIPIKIKEKAYETIIEIGRYNDYRTVNFLGYKYLSKFIAIDLSKHSRLFFLVDFIKIMKQQCSFIIGKSKETTFEFKTRKTMVNIMIIVLSLSLRQTLSNQTF